MLLDPFDFFLIDSDSGELRSAKPLDREVLRKADNDTLRLIVSVCSYIIFIVFIIIDHILYTFFRQQKL